MASGWTDKGFFRMFETYFQGATIDTNYYIALCDDSVTPTIAINTKGELGEIPTGNGYTIGGIQLTKNATDFDVLTEAATTLIQVKDMIWTATGNFPSSGNGARWSILTDDNVTQGSRFVYAWHDLVSNRNITNTQTLTLQDIELNIS